MFVFSVITVLMMASSNNVLLREILYSIFVGNLGKGKHKRKKAEKIHRSHSMHERITFSYVVPYLYSYKKDFYFYYKLSIAYSIGCAAILFVLIILGFYATPVLYASCWSIIALVNFCFFAIVSFTAKVGPDHRTKYDRD